MTPKITDEQRQAILAGHGQPVDVEDEQTHTRYVLVDQETHERAIAALRQQEDIAAIRQGLDAAAEGRESTLESQTSRFADLAQFAADLPDAPSDIASQHDHYLYGTPKQ